MSRSVVILGSGNVATHLARMFQQNSYAIECIWSRTLDHARQLADEVDAYAYTDDLLSIPLYADYYIIATSDSAIPSVVRSIPALNEDAILIHTSGSTDISVLSKAGRYGVLYPCQSFSKNISFDYSNIEWLVEGNDDESLLSVRQLAESIPHKTVTEADSNQRRTLHMAAVWASNFTNRMLVEAYDIMSGANLDPHLLDSLVRQTVDKALSTNPRDAQTGPARRRDENIINMHLSLLSDNPELENLYRLISKRISDNQ
ncbi:MAG: DUF2520 domain-containing protein [Bacteroidales bacterium]|nr:DUF2520 domain-containing protein [Bacteroidales bacterium]